MEVLNFHIHFQHLILSVSILKCCLPIHLKQFPILEQNVLTLYLLLKYFQREKKFKYDLNCKVGCLGYLCLWSLSATSCLPILIGEESPGN